jgi:hypothetical protein
MQFVAPNYTHVPASQTAQRIGDTPASGGTSSLIVYGITCSATANGEILFYEEDGTTVIARFQLTTAATVSFSHSIKFLAPRGLKVTTPANASCTVYHSSTGA